MSTRVGLRKRRWRAPQICAMSDAPKATPTNCPGVCLGFLLYRVILRRCSLSALRGVCLLTMMGLGLMAGSARAEDFEAGKSAAKIFESDCVTCHRSPRGLARGMGSRALVDFLREHYTTGLGPANELASYLQSGTADGDERRAPRAAGEKLRAGDQHERAQTAAPSDTDANQQGSGRKHRHAASTPEPGATSEHDAAAPPVHKRHHARTAEPTNDTEPSANAQPRPPAEGQIEPDATPQPTRESRHKHRRSPKDDEPAHGAKQPPDMTPTGVAGPAAGASEPSQPGTGPGKEPASATAHGAEPNREGLADTVEPGSNTAPAPPVSLHASETGRAPTSEPPSAPAGSSDQPAFSAPSP